MLCSISFATGTRAQTRSGPDADTTRRLSYLAGLGSQQGVFVGMMWSIPFARNGRDALTMAWSAGLRPFKFTFVPSVSLGWRMIGKRDVRGGMVGITASTESSSNSNETTRRTIVTLHPGVLFRAGESLLAISIGAGPAFNRRTLVTFDGSRESYETEIFINAQASLNFDL